MIRSQSATAPLSDQLKNVHIDKRVLPLFNDTKSRNISIEKKFYDVVQPVGQNMSSKTQSFLINATSNSMISLSESYFVVNCHFQVNTAVGPPSGCYEYAPCQFASSLFIDQIRTRVSNVDVSDNHAQGLYAYSSFSKAVISKPREPDTWMMPSSTIMYVPSGGGADRQPVFAYQQESDAVSQTLECVGCSNQQIDSCKLQVFPNPPADTGTNPHMFSNLNAMYLHNLIDVYPSPLNWNGAATLPTGNGALEFKILPREGIWQCPDYIPTNTQVQVDLTIADISKFIQWRDTTDTVSKPTFVLDGITLFLARVQPKEDALVSVNEALNVTPFTYPIMFSRTESYQIAVGSRLATISTLNGILPNVVMLQLVQTDTFTRTDPQTQAFSSGMLSRIGDGTVAYPNITRLWITAGSNTFPLNSMYLCNKSSAGFSSVQASYNEYKKLCLDSDKPFLSYRHWLNHYQVYCFNLMNDDSPFDSPTDLTNSGNIQVNIEFDSALAQSYTIILTALQTAQISIDKTRSVTREGF